MEVGCKNLLPITGQFSSLHARKILSRKKNRSKFGRLKSFPKIGFDNLIPSFQDDETPNDRQMRKELVGTLEPRFRKVYFRGPKERVSTSLFALSIKELTGKGGLL